MPAKVLIVDDEPSILATMAPLLRSRGYEVLTAMSGRAAVESIDRDKPDLIVLDLGLPDIDGIEVCRMVREHCATPIVVLSARGAEGDKVRALDIGADDHRRHQAADFDDEHDGIPDLPARIELGEGVDGRLPQDGGIPE